MKLTLIQNIILSVKSAFGFAVYAEIYYKRKSDGVVKRYLVNLSNVENSREYLVTYAFAEFGNRGGIRSFIKSNVRKIKLVKRESHFVV